MVTDGARVRQKERAKMSAARAKDRATKREDWEAEMCEKWIRRRVIAVRAVQAMVEQGEC